MGYRLAQMLQSPDMGLRRALRLSSGPLGFDKAGLFAAGYVGDEPEGVSGSTATLTQSHNRIQIINPGAARTILLPEDGIRAGEAVVIVNRSSGDLMTIQAADASAVDIIDLGYIRCIALSNDPAANTDWYVENVYEEHSHSTDIDLLYAADPSMAVLLTRNNSTVSFVTEVTTTAAKSGTGNPIFLTATPARFRPTLIRRVGAPVMNNAVYVAGWLKIQNTGIWLWEITTLGTWTGGANARLLAVTGAYEIR